MPDKMICMCCHEEITPDNDGMEIAIGENESFYQCDDCHYIEYGERILAMNLVFNQ